MVQREMEFRTLGVSKLAVEIDHQNPSLFVPIPERKTGRNRATPPVSAPGSALG